MKYIFMRYPKGKTKAVTLSYDDGSKTDIKLVETIKKYNMKCTFNLCSSIIIENHSLKKNEIEEFIINNGHEIAVHGAYHRASGSQRPVAAIKDVLDCRIYLEETFNKIIRGMAYPDSGIRHIESTTSYEKIRDILTNTGIVYSRTLGNDNDTFALPNDWYAWNPTAHHKNPKLFEFVEKFVNLKIDELYISGRYPRLFYLWGHSSEFKRDDNWDLLERFCNEIANKEDTWYATNIEIYDYVNAYNSLVFSANETLVYNPSLLTIWFNVDGKLYSIEPGQTIEIKQ